MRRLKEWMESDPDDSFYSFGHGIKRMLGFYPDFTVIDLFKTVLLGIAGMFLSFCQIILSTFKCVFSFVGWIIGMTLIIVFGVIIGFPVRCILMLSRFARSRLGLAAQSGVDKNDRG